VDGKGFGFRGRTPRRSRRQAWNARERDAEDLLVGTARRQMDFDGGLHLDDARGDLDEAQTQSVELSRAPSRSLGRRHAQAPQDPIGAGMQKQAKLIGRRLHA
jgi:hypothetical protein